MKNMKYILSPCGTSLLTNAATSDERSLIPKYANKKSPENIPPADREKLEALIRKVSEKIASANHQEAAKISAELNGIISIYEGSLPQKEDKQVLLSTDTWLGETTANLVKQWLNANAAGMQVEVRRLDDLRMTDLEEFRSALSRLVKMLYEELPGYSTAGYKVIFNLTGGFKSVQGFLQAIANFLADETVYIFERSTELMRIPRLPVRMAIEDSIKDNINYYRNIANAIPAAETPDGIPETFLFTVDGESCLSEWGDLMWEEAKKTIYSESLVCSPSPDKIKYSEEFSKTAERLPKDRLLIVNKQIDQLNKYLHDQTNPNSLDFKKLAGKPFKDSTHEFDAWSDKDAKRVFGHFEGKGASRCFVLDRLDHGLH